MAIWSKAESLKLVRVNHGLISSFLQVAIRHLKFTISDLAGVLAQLVERLNGIEEVTGSNPVGSTFPPGNSAVGQTILTDQSRSAPPTAR